MTGVQTCALPIYLQHGHEQVRSGLLQELGVPRRRADLRSEEAPVRRVRGRHELPGDRPALRWDDAQVRGRRDVLDRGWWLRMLDGPERRNEDASGAGWFDRDVGMGTRTLQKIMIAGEPRWISARVRGLVIAEPPRLS